MLHRGIPIRKLLLVIAFVVALGLVAACSDEPTPAPTAAPTASGAGATQPTAMPAVKQGGTVRLTGRVPRTLDTAATGCSRTESQQAFSFVYDSLLGFPSGPGTNPLSQEVVGYLAESWGEVDSRTYRFKIKQGVKFANVAPVNGRELTSQDVKFSLLRYAAGPECAPETKEIASVDTPDKYTVVVNLKRDFSPFLQQLALSQAWILPKEAGIPDEKGVQGLSFNDPKAFIGSGPFILDKFDRTAKLVSYKRNPDFYQTGKPYVDGVERRDIADYATQLGLLRTGQIEVLALNPGTQDEVKRTHPNLVFLDSLRTGSSAYRLAMWKPPFDDVRVRQAVALAFNQDEFIQAYGGGGRRCGFLGPTQPEWMYPCDQLPAEVRRLWEDKADDVELAKKLLADAGYPNGFKTSINLSNSAQLQPRYLPDLMAAQLARVGITATIERIEHATHLRGHLKGDWEGITVTTAGDDTVLNRLQMLLPGHTLNVNRLDDPFLKQKFEEFVATTDKAKQKEIITQVSVKMANDINVIYLPSEPLYWAWQPYLKDFVPAGGDPEGRGYVSAWLDK